MARPIPETFDVAFSLAGANRELVGKIAKALEAKLGKPTVFYDEWFSHYLPGDRGDLKLQEIFSDRSTVVVLCVSGEYGKSTWTATEHDAILRRKPAEPSGPKKQWSMDVFPIRVGDGWPEGLPETTICHEVRAIPPEEVADLIVARLGLVRASPAVAWPQVPEDLQWNVANHLGVRDSLSAFLKANSAHRMLVIRGTTGVGKTRTVEAMLSNVLDAPGFCVLHVDFRGTIGVRIQTYDDPELRELAQMKKSKRLSQQLGIALSFLKERARSAMVVLDSYESASDVDKSWVEANLLPSLIRATWLRVVIAGQSGPTMSGKAWERYATAPKALSKPLVEDWFDFSRKNEHLLTLENVQHGYLCARGVPEICVRLFGPVN